MEIQYDADSDMLYIGLLKRPSIESEEVAPGIVLDYDTENRVVGIEITDGSKLADLSQLDVLGLTLPHLVMSQEEKVVAEEQ